MKWTTCLYTGKLHMELRLKSKRVEHLYLAVYLLYKFKLVFVRVLTIVLIARTMGMIDWMIQKWIIMMTHTISFVCKICSVGRNNDLYNLKQTITTNYLQDIYACNYLLEPMGSLKDTLNGWTKIFVWNCVKSEIVKPLNCESTRALDKIT